MGNFLGHFKRILVELRSETGSAGSFERMTRISIKFQNDSSKNPYSRGRGGDPFFQSHNFCDTASLFSVDVALLLKQPLFISFCSFQQRELTTFFQPQLFCLTNLPFLVFWLVGTIFFFALFLSRQKPITHVILYVTDICNLCIVRLMRCSLYASHPAATTLL